MKMSSFVQDEKIHFACKGKIKSSQDFLAFKKDFLATLQNFSPLKDIVVSLDSFPIDLNLIGFLLNHIKQNGLKIQVLVTNYSCFRMLEDLFLLEVLDVKYQKEK